MSMFGSLRWVSTRWRIARDARSAPGSAGLLIFVFHALFEDRRELQVGNCYPRQGITLGRFRDFLEALLDHGIVIQDLATALGRPAAALVAAITFDDGYANNARALPTLERLNAPATFFISTEHVKAQKAFWWDALFRETSRSGVPERLVRGEIRSLKRLTAEEIETRLTARYGPRVLEPVGDLDRPFTTAELVRFGRSPLVTLGNHTRNHAILINYDRTGAAAQIRAAQQDLTGWTGRAPAAIAYPNGDFDGDAVTEAREAGLRIGVTVRPGLNRLDRLEPMTLRRLTVSPTLDARRQVAALARAARDGRL
jgi:peptidoglycan/xylan/chitin deacetylase (PgdA/CDA1 family)